MRGVRVWLPLQRSGKMAISYSIDPERRLVETHIDGETSVGEIEEYIQRLVDDPAYRPEYDSLVDLRESPSLFTAAEIRSLSEFVRAYTAPTPSRLAVIAGTEAAFGLLRMYEAFTEDLPQSFRVFRDMNHAREWLGLARVQGRVPSGQFRVQ
jgi:hypothetical protein